jgi:hypothetical protein
MRSVRIGAAQGFYGDRLAPAVELARNGALEYLCFDCLAELTMAILQKDRQKDPALGYTRDVVPVMRALLPHCVATGVKLITNAGGINPAGAAAAIMPIARELGLKVRFATVTGDDLLPRMAELNAAGVLTSLGSDALPPAEALRRLLFANAYLGAAPILRALEAGADIVLTGRTTDTAQYLAAAAHAFGWSLGDLNRAALGVVAGHLLECTAQVTGGNFSGAWWEMDGLENIGYPLAEFYEDGSFVVSKTPGSGGRVSVDTLREQLLYEIHDPKNFISPDVVIDMTTITLEDVGPDQVRVSGATGKPPPPTLKVVGGYPNGFASEGRVVYSWPDALPKARAAEALFRKLLVAEEVKAIEIRVEYFGINAIHEATATPPSGEPSEVMLRFAVRTANAKDAAKVGRILPPMALSGPPHMTGLSGISSGRELFGIASFLVPRELVESGVDIKYEDLAPATSWAAQPDGGTRR